MGNSPAGAVVGPNAPSGAGGDHARPAASKLPVHMYWRYHTKKQSWMPCVHVTRWFQASNPGELVLHESKTKGGQVHIAWAHEVPPSLPYTQDGAACQERWA